MTYEATLTCDFGSHTPALSDVRVGVDGQTLSTGIAAVADSQGSGFTATVATLTDGFRGPFVFYDNADVTKYCVGNVTPEHEQLDAKTSTRSTFDHTADTVITDAASRTASQADITTLATQASVNALPNAAAINAEVDTALADYDAPTKLELDTAQAALVAEHDATQASIGGLSIPTAGDIATAVWSAATRTLTAASLTAADIWSHVTRSLTAPVETDAVSRTASQADVSSLASQISVNALPTAADVRSEIDTSSTQIAAIVADTNELQTDDIPAQIAALNNISTADIDARLTAFGLPTLTEVTAAFTEIKGAGWTVTDTLEALRNQGDAAWTTATGFSTFDPAVDAVITDAATGTEVAANAAANLAAIAALNDLSSADVQNAIGSSEPVDANIVQVATTPVTDIDDFKGAGSSGVTAGDIDSIADAVWDEATAGHQTAGTAGAALLDGSGDVTSVNGVSVTSPDDFKASAADIAAQLVAAGTELMVMSPLSTTGDLTLTTHTTLDFTISAAIPANYGKLLFTIKAIHCESDAQAILQAVYDTAEGGNDHLVTLNGATSTPAWAKLTPDQPNGATDIKIADDATALLSPSSQLIWDLKYINANSESGIIAQGGVSIVNPVTKTI